ncbi:hypothetical protein Btru_026760 [Bulinus truncatus]|nr:hypothetical protein Btru_026760 [Bulinus truncatus]
MAVIDKCVGPMAVIDKCVGPMAVIDKCVGPMAVIDKCVGPMAVIDKCVGPMAVIDKCVGPMAVIDKCVGPMAVIDKCVGPMAVIDKCVGPMAVIDKCVGPMAVIDKCVGPMAVIDKCVGPMAVIDKCVGPMAVIDKCVGPMAVIDKCKFSNWAISPLNSTEQLMNFDEGRSRNWGFNKQRMLSINVCASVKSPMKTDSDAQAAAVQFMGQLRKNEDTLVEVTKSLAKKDKGFIQAMFTTPVGEWTPMHACTLRGARKLMKIALKAGVDPNLEMGIPDGLPGRCSPLHLAAYRGDVSIIQLLVQYEADLEKRDSKNYTPLHYAVLKRNTLAARKLLKFGADASGLTLEERMFYKDDIDSRSSGILCVPVKASSSSSKTNSNKYSDSGASNSKQSGGDATSLNPRYHSKSSRYGGVGASNSKQSGVSGSKYAGVSASSSKDKSRVKIS